MNDDHILSSEQIRRLRMTIGTVELTGHQMAVIANALAFNLVHNDCLMKQNAYSDIYYEEITKLHDYISSFVQGIIGENDNEQQKNVHRPQK